MNKAKPTMFYMCVKAGSQLGLPGSNRRVDRVSPGQLPTGFLLRPRPVPGSGRPGPGSTRWAGPGFKTMLSCVWTWIDFYFCNLLIKTSSKQKIKKKKRKRKKEFTGQIHLGIKLLFSLLLSWKDLERYMCRGFLTFLLDRLFRTSLPWWFRVFSWNCHKPFIHIRTQLYLPATTQITGAISSDPFLPPRSKINIF